VFIGSQEFSSNLAGKMMVEMVIVVVWKCRWRGWE